MKSQEHDEFYSFGLLQADKFKREERGRTYLVVDTIWQLAHLDRTEDQRLELQETLDRHKGKEVLIRTLWEKAGGDQGLLFAAFLRKHVIDQAIESKSLPRDRTKWLTDDEANSIANGITWYTSLFHDLTSGRDNLRSNAQESLMRIAKLAHMNSIEELREAFTTLKEQLKLELSSDVWLGYFGP